MTSPGCPICFCPLSADGNFLAIGSHDNCIYIYGVSDNGRKYTRVGKCSVRFFRFLGGCSRDQVMVAGSLCRAQKGKRNLPSVLLSQGHSSFITHLDWSVNSQFLVSNSGDYEILYCE